MTGLARSFINPSGILSREGLIPLFFRSNQLGSTVTTGKLAAAFKCPNGRFVYVLFEKTYEANCHPHDPQWGCIAIGEYADVMSRVFGNAVSCKGGMLQGSGGDWIKPEDYIAAWRRELIKPVQMLDSMIFMKPGDKWNSSISTDRLKEVRAALAQIGRLDVFTRITNDGQASVSLYNDTDVVLALYGVNKLFAPWRVLDHSSALSVHDYGLGAETRVEKIEPPAVRVCQISRDEVLVQLGSNGQWQHWGPQYAAVGRYISEVAYKCEMRQTGSFKRLIAGFRDACATALAVPDEAKLKFKLNLTRNADDNIEAWQLEQFCQLAKELGAGPAVTEFECSFAEIKSKEDALYRLRHLDKNHVTWEVPAIPEAQEMQLSLLAA